MRQTRHFTDVVRHDHWWAQGYSWKCHRAKSGCAAQDCCRYSNHRCSRFRESFGDVLVVQLLLFENAFLFHHDDDDVLGHTTHYIACTRRHRSRHTRPSTDIRWSFMRCAAYISFTENVEVVLNALFILISFTENDEINSAETIHECHGGMSRTHWTLHSIVTGWDDRWVREVVLWWCIIWYNMRICVPWPASPRLLYRYVLCGLLCSCVGSYICIDMY